jgi:t-SNARE complex subunit (syntaxin)
MSTREGARQEGRHGEFSNLLDNDAIAHAAASSGGPSVHLELSGAVDILWQLKDPRSKDEHVIEMAEESREFMVEFFERVRQCKDNMSPIRQNISTIKEIQGKIITEVSQTKSKEFSNKYDTLLSQTSRQARAVKDELKAMEEENKMFEKKHGQNSAEFKIHQNMTAHLTKQFMELMGDFESTQVGKFSCL